MPYWDTTSSSRVCAACGGGYDSDDYSNNQWSKGVGVSRCRTCVEEGIETFRGDSHVDDSDTDDSDDYSRCSACLKELSFNSFSISQWEKEESRCLECVESARFPTERAIKAEVGDISYDDTTIYARGGFRDVYKGHYMERGTDFSGRKKKRPCVVKVIRDRRMRNRWFAWDATMVAKATQLVHTWNHSGFGGPAIQVNQATTLNTAYGQAVAEPFISNYIKWNSNSGFVNTGAKSSDVMQALSHFSYHQSGGQYCLCDLQGGTNGDSIIITDPALISQNKRFGPTDLGQLGMWTFFAHHNCTAYCQPHWTQPRLPPFYQELLEPVYGTSMI
eukprot:TRINITY_DN8661_c0_g1_i1.p1 TRINITY_DN8661_c0_g1~~TRINITY_DN8661_c0_g1_i1.p1  ORF type:complete len:332 (+),score=65.51 TRINITY_DN8661_c0_g1_i1:209-1204(+)